MKSLAFLFSMFLVGCSGVSDWFDIPLPPTAQETYQASNGNGIRMYMAGATNPVTVTPVPQGTVMSFELLGGCTYSLDLTAVAGDQAEYWASQPVTLTYDADVPMCGMSYYCEYEAVMVGTIADVSLNCIFN